MPRTLQDRRYSWPASTRKWGGHTYVYLYMATTKKDAEYEAKRHAAGKPFVVSKFKSGWAIYIRK